MSELATIVLVFVRCGALLLSLPVLSAPQFPVRIRIGLAALLSLLVAPALPPVDLGALGFFDVIWAMLKEVGVGLLMGFSARLTFHALEFFGALVGMEIGLNMAASLNPMTESRTEVFGVAAFYLGALLMFALDIHHWILAAFQRSFAVVPIGQASLTMPLYYTVVERVARLFQSGMLMAAPVTAISFLVSITFALVNRAVPSMNVFAESFSFRIVGGILVFALTLNLTAQHVANSLRRIPDDMMKVAQYVSRH